MDHEKAGFVEIGIPVTDPFVDGAVIRQTHKEALEQKISSDDVIRTLEEIRRRFTFKVVLMTYKEGVEYFHLSDVPKDLYDGFLCVDGEFPTGSFPNQITVLGRSLSDESIAKALAHNDLFAYIVSGEGKTGSFDKLPTEYVEVVKKSKICFKDTGLYRLWYKVRRGREGSHEEWCRWCHYRDRVHKALPAWRYGCFECLSGRVEVSRCIGWFSNLLSMTRGVL